MMVGSIVVEQLEVDGSLKTFRFYPGPRSGDLVIALPDTYDMERSGPFHFLDEEDENRFEDGFSKCRVRRLAAGQFQKDGECLVFRTEWSGIPTLGLSYYALILPPEAAVNRLSVTDPRGRQLRRTCYQDWEKRRYVIYVECRSPTDRFDFDLEVDCSIRPSAFDETNYTDSCSVSGFRQIDDYRWNIGEERAATVKQFLIHGDAYFAEQVGSQGAKASITDSSFNHRARD